MFHIQTFNTISDKGLSQLPAEKYAINDNTQQPDAILLRSYDLKITDVSANVKAVGRAGAGVNNVPVKELTQRGIPVFNTPGANANAVKELVIASLFMVSRHLYEGLQYAKQLPQDLEKMEAMIETEKKRFKGSELVGKTLGVVGLGAIGVKVANAALALGMRVLGYDPTMSVQRAWELSAQVEQAKSLQALLFESDFLTVHVPLMEQTKQLFNANSLQYMRKNAVLLNFSRAQIIDEQAVLYALQTRALGLYVTDFPHPVFYDCPYVYAFPHLGASTEEAEELCAIRVTQQVQDFLESGHIRSAVNFPDVELARVLGSHRLTVANANIPNMVAQVSNYLASAGVNILHMINQSRGEVAYTLIDMDQPIQPAVLKEMQKVHGILMVRAIT